MAHIHLSGIHARRVIGYLISFRLIACFALTHALSPHVFLLQLPLGIGFFLHTGQIAGTFSMDATPIFRNMQQPDYASSVA